MASRTHALVVLVTCASRAQAKRLSTHLIRRHLAACVNVVPMVDSVFWWRGKVEHARETLLIIKTTPQAFERLKAEVVRLHSYDTPEIIALPIVRGHKPYLTWVRASTQ